MESNNEKIKPSGWLTTFLFVFMVIVVIMAIVQYNASFNVIDNNLQPLSTNMLIFSAVIDIAAYLYAFLGIYKTLQANSYAITIMKFSVFFVLAQVAIRSLGNIAGVPQLAVKYMLYGLLFLLIFFIYLFKSKHLEEYIPKQKRKFGIWGWIGVGIYVMVTVMMAVPCGEKVVKVFASRAIEKSEVLVEDGEFSDGLAKFRPLESWKTDTIYGADSTGYMHVFSGDSCTIMVATVNGECTSRLDYYLIMNKMRQSLLPDTLKLKEELYRDSIINGNCYYLNSYSYLVSSGKNFWTVSALVSSDKYKVTMMSIFEKGSPEKSLKISPEFMKNVRFDLKK